MDQPAPDVVDAANDEDRSRATAPASVAEPQPRPGAIKFRDVTDERVPAPCRGDGTEAKAQGLFQTVIDMAGGVAIGDFDGEDLPDVLATAPGLRDVCLLLAAGSKPYRRAETPKDGLPKRVLGFSVIDGDQGAEPILLGLGPAVHWVRQGPARFVAKRVRTFKVPGNSYWISTAFDLSSMGIAGAAIGLASALPNDTTDCPDCGVALLPPGAFTLGPAIATGRPRSQSDPVWVSHPAAAITSAFAFGLVPAAFVTDLLGGDKLYAFTEKREIVDRAWHAGVATGLLDISFRSRGADLGDVDGDGLDDLVVGTERNGVRLYAAERRGFFLDRTVRSGLFWITAGRSWFSVLLHDFDGDGDRDLAAAGDSGLLVVENIDGRFSTPLQVPALPASRGLALGDLDGDGDADLVVGLRGGGVRILLNESATPTWRRHLRPEWEGRPGTPALGVRIRLRWADNVIQAQERRRIRGYMSASQPLVGFARSGKVPAGTPMLTAQSPGGPELRLPWPEGATKPAGGLLGVAKPMKVVLK